MFIVNGGWGDYGAFGDCTKTCGTGTKTKSRVCNNPVPAHGGDNCVGSADATESCNTNPCPGKNNVTCQL